MSDGGETAHAGGGWPPSRGRRPRESSRWHVLRGAEAAVLRKKQQAGLRGGELPEPRKQEQERAAAFAELRATKEEEIAAAEKQIEDKGAELADADLKLADATEDIAETKAALDEDLKLLVNLKTTREAVDKDAAIRKMAWQGGPDPH